MMHVNRVCDTSCERICQAESEGGGRARRWIPLSLWLISSPIIVAGQVAITGKITGLVTDTSGAAVPQATITVQGPALMATRTVTAQADGSFLIDQLPIGTYEMIVTAPGFKTYVQKGIVISAGFTATLAVTLEVGQGPGSRAAKA